MMMFFNQPSSKQNDESPGARQPQNPPPKAKNEFDDDEFDDDDDDEETFLNTTMETQLLSELSFTASAATTPTSSPARNKPQHPRQPPQEEQQECPPKATMTMPIVSNTATTTTTTSNTTNLPRKTTNQTSTLGATTTTTTMYADLPQLVNQWQEWHEKHHENNDTNIPVVDVDTVASYCSATEHILFRLLTHLVFPRQQHLSLPEVAQLHAPQEEDEEEKNLAVQVRHLFRGSTTTTTTTTTPGGDANKKEENGEETKWWSDGHSQKSVYFDANGSTTTASQRSLYFDAVNDEPEEEWPNDPASSEASDGGSLYFEMMMKSSSSQKSSLPLDAAGQKSVYWDAASQKSLYVDAASSSCAASQQGSVYLDVEGDMDLDDHEHESSDLPLAEQSTAPAPTLPVAASDQPNNSSLAHVLLFHLPRLLQTTLKTLSNSASLTASACRVVSYWAALLVVATNLPDSKSLFLPREELQSFLGSTETANSILPDLLQTVMETLKGHVADAAVVSSACRAMHHLLAASAAAGGTVSPQQQSGMCRAVLDALGTPKAVDARALAHGCTVLGELLILWIQSTTNEIRNEAGGGTVEHVESKADQQHLPVDCLNSTSVFNEVKENGISKPVSDVTPQTILQGILTAMQAHVNHRRLQRCACQALQNTTAAVTMMTTSNRDSDYPVLMLSPELLNQITKLLIQAMDAHPFDSSLQSFACGALSNLALFLNIRHLQHHPSLPPVESNGPAVSLFNTTVSIVDTPADGKNDMPGKMVVVALLATMTVHATNVHVLKRACDALSNLTFHPGGSDMIAEAGGIEAILAAMSAPTGNSADHVKLLSSACGALRNLAYKHATNKKDIAQAGGIVMIMNAMKQYPQDTELQSAGCDLLRNLSHDSDHNQASIVQEHGVDTILAAMKGHQCHVETQAYGCAVLSLLVGCLRMGAGFDRSTATKAIVAAMTRLPHAEQVQLIGCDALNNLVADTFYPRTVGNGDDHYDDENQYVDDKEKKEEETEEIRKYIVQADGILALLTAMKSYPSNINLLRSACSALSNLAFLPEISKAIAEATDDAIPVIVETIKTHATDAPLQSSGCGLLRNLAYKNEANQAAIVEAGGITIIIVAMKYHSLDALAQVTGCDALYNLAANNDKNKILISQAGAIPIVLAAVKSHASNVKLQRSAAAVISTLAYNPQISALIARSGGIRAILTAMQSNTEGLSSVGGSDAKLQAEYCGALRNLAYKDVKNKAKIIAAGGIELIVAAMRAHPNRDTVQRNASDALNNLASGGSFNTKELIAKLGGIETILFALKTKKNGCGTTSARVATSCCGALSTLAYKHTKNKTLIVTTGGLDLILSAMKAHPDDAPLRSSGWDAIHNLMTVKDAKSLLVAGGGIGVVRKGLEANPNDRNLQRIGRDLGIL